MDKLDKLMAEATAMHSDYKKLLAREGSMLQDVEAPKQLRRLSERGPSKAASIGAGLPWEDKARMDARTGGPRSRFGKRLAKALYGGDQDAVGTIARSFALMHDGDPDLYREGKANLQAYGFFRAEGLPERTESYHLTRGRVGNDPTGGWPGASHAEKATLGTTGTTGGYVLPNNLVDRVAKPSTQRAFYLDLVTCVDGVAVRGVDQPYRLGPPPRATFQDWGQTKENLNETYGSYTATLATLARIMDVGKQYLRFSAGAAEQDVMDELTRAYELGINYYTIAGAGTGTVGTGDPTTGVYTALAASSSFNGYTTAFPSPANNTLLGSLAEAITQGASALAKRNREPEAIVVDAATFWTAIGQGTDTAGFWTSPTGGPTGFSTTGSGQLRFWGIPIYWDSNLGTNAATKIAIMGEWSALKLYRGLEFRIDSSDVAGTRWDQNLVGFRMEAEIGLNASTAVNIGAFQLITSAIA